MRLNDSVWPLEGRFGPYFEYVPRSTCFIAAPVLAAVSLAATAIGTGVGIMGQMQQASANQASANYQAQVARNNQTIAQQNADYARQAGTVEAQTQSMKTASLIGQEVAAQGASGIDPTTGSPRDVVTGSRDTGRLDALNIMQQAEMKARGFNIQGSDFAATAGLDTMKAQQAGQAGLIGAGTSALSGVSSFADKWSKYQTDFGSKGGSFSGTSDIALTGGGPVQFTFG